jgi:predicted restriction endonuclease
MSLTEIDKMVKLHISLEKYDELLAHETYRKLYLTNLFNENMLSLYFENNYDYIYEETSEKKDRRFQYRFRKELIERYETCIITGISHRSCEAAHINPHSKCSGSSKYDVNNGLLICKNLHTLFDSEDKELKIDPETLIVKLSNDILNDPTYEEYHKYHNKKIRCDLNENTRNYLKQYYTSPKQ